MASIGGIRFSGISGVQETTIALANLNVDFSVVRYEAKPEFQELGKQLSKRRKVEAEDGMIHFTARRLGALFADVVPPVDSLCKLYGMRASELASNPSANPKGSTAHGPLAGHIGLDGTALWAAATSGPGAIQVHLLACMLARQWKGSGAKAVSIWSELVTSRQAELELRLKDEIFHASYVSLARMHVGLNELAEWDASARARIKLMLIIENIGSGFRSHSTLYHDVIENWKSALLFMDKLASGVAVRVEELPVLLGLASWHLYPEIALLGYNEPKQVAFNDDLVPSAAIITIGMQAVSNEAGGLSWTLPLRHLRYYGKPTVATSVLGLASLRIPFERCVLVAVGSILSTWGVYGADILQSIKFLHVLSERIQHENHAHDKCDLNCTMKHQYYQSSANDWTTIIGKQCENFMKAKEHELREMKRYINLGRIRYQNFLSQSWTPGPALGLHSVPTFLSLVSMDEQILLLRRFARESTTWPSCENAVIYYRPNDVSPGELASLIPNTVVVDGIERKIHRRWLLPVRTAAPGKTTFNRIPDDSRLPAVDYSRMIVRAYRIAATSHEPCGMLEETSISDCNGSFLDQQYYILRQESPDTLEWKPSQTPTERTIAQLTTELFDGLIANDEIAEKTPGSSRRTIIAGLKICGVDIAYAGMRYRRFRCSRSVSLYLPEQSDNHKSLIFPLDFLCRAIKDVPLDQPVFGLYIQAHRKDKNESGFFQALSNLQFASTVYSELPNADIDIAVAAKPLGDAKWPNSSHIGNFSRSSRFACIAYFDSGGLIDISSTYFHRVMAISSNNWLYVANAILKDPKEESHGISCFLGNVGKHGMSLLTSVGNPELKEDFLDTWEMASYEEFDGQYENNFGGTSLHLSMTGSDEALNIGVHGARYVDVSRVEAKVSIHHKGEWYGDIDILNLFAQFSSSAWLLERVLPQHCLHSLKEKNDRSQFGQITSIDTWAEMLGPPLNTSIIRAKGNWDARLALAAVMRQRQNNAIIAGDEVCWACTLETARSLNISPYELLVLC